MLEKLNPLGYFFHGNEEFHTVIQTIEDGAKRVESIL